MANRKAIIKSTLKTLELQLGVDCIAVESKTGSPMSLNDLRGIVSMKFVRCLEAHNECLEFSIIGDSINPLTIEDFYVINNLQKLINLNMSWGLTFAEFYDLNCN